MSCALIERNSINWSGAGTADFVIIDGTRSRSPSSKSAATALDGGKTLASCKSKTRPNAWTPQQLNLLRALAGEVPWPMLRNKYNRQAKTRGWPVRSEIALRRQCERHHIGRRAMGEWVTAGFIRTLMGISYEAIKRWVRYGWLPAFTCESIYYVRRRDLRNLAKFKPHLFGGQDRSALVQLFDSEQLADEILAMKLPLPRQCKPVICIETGIRYKSIGTAARAVYVTPSRLQSVIDTHYRAAGYTWRFA